MINQGVRDTSSNTRRPARLKSSQDRVRPSEKEQPAPGNRRETKEGTEGRYPRRLLTSLTSEWPLTRILFMFQGYIHPLLWLENRPKEGSASVSAPHTCPIPISIELRSENQFTSDGMIYLKTLNVGIALISPRLAMRPQYIVTAFNKISPEAKEYVFYRPWNLKYPQLLFPNQRRLPRQPYSSSRSKLRNILETHTHTRAAAYEQMRLRFYQLIRSSPSKIHAYGISAFRTNVCSYELEKENPIFSPPPAALPQSIRGLFKLWMRHRRIGGIPIYSIRRGMSNLWKLLSRPRL